MHVTTILAVVSFGILKCSPFPIIDTSVIFPSQHDTALSLWGKSLSFLTVGRIFFKIIKRVQDGVLESELKVKALPKCSHENEVELKSVINDLKATSAALCAQIVSLKSLIIHYREEVNVARKETMAARQVLLAAVSIQESKQVNDLRDSFTALKLKQQENIEKVRTDILLSIEEERNEVLGALRGDDVNVDQIRLKNEIASMKQQVIELENMLRIERVKSTQHIDEIKLLNLGYDSLSAEVEQLKEFLRQDSSVSESNEVCNQVGIENPLATAPASDVVAVTDDDDDDDADNDIWSEHFSYKSNTDS